MHKYLYFLTTFYSLCLSLLAQAAPDSYTICTWNISNYGVTDRFIDNRPVKEAMKPESEIQSMLAILKRVQPDILGVSEVLQTSNDVMIRDLHQNLLKAGLEYPHYVTVRGEDTRIQCVLFSKFPMHQHPEAGTASFPVIRKSASTGEKQKDQMRMSRGIVHATVRISPTLSTDIMLVHLKSRRPFPEIIGDTPLEKGDDFVRRQEALILKSEMNRVLEADPKKRLMVMGDLNDIPRSHAVKTVIGKKDATHRMFDLWLKDWLGDWWTHYYIPDKQYERIDYMIVNQLLFRDWIESKSYIYRQKESDPPIYNSYIPSDHRALVATFSIPEKP